MRVAPIRHPITLLALVHLLGTLPSFAATYFVAPAGNDSAAGSEAAPWRTLQRAADHPALTGGDTVYVRGGTYAQSVTLTRSGTDAARPITFAAYPGEYPRLDGTSLTPPDDTTGLITINSAGFLRVVGFELANYRANDGSTNHKKVPCGIYLHGTCRDIEIRGNNIHDIANHFANGDAFGFVAYGDTVAPITGLVVADNEVHHCSTGNSETLTINGNVVGFRITGNRIHHNTNIGIDIIGYEATCPDPAQDRARSGVVRANTVWECTSTANPAYNNLPAAGGIYVDGGTDILIENNTSYQNDIGLELTSEHTGRNSDHCTARNNLIWGNRIGGIFLGGSEPQNGGSEYNLVASNTLWANDTRGDGNGEIQFSHWCAHNTLRHNLVVAGAQALLCSNPVAATLNGRATNTDNQFDWNLWWAPGGPTASQWQWKNTTRTGFDGASGWKTATGQDPRSLFVDPRLRNASLVGTADLHLRSDSPAVDAGDPTAAPAAGESDLDRLARLTGTRLDIGADELSPYDAWRRTRFGAGEPATSLPAADPDADGVPNILEYALGGDPLSASSAPQPLVGTAAGSSAPTFTFARQGLASDLIYRVQVSTDLVVWTDGSTYGPSGDSPNTALTTEIASTVSGNTTLLTLRANLAPGSPRLFLRLATSFAAAAP